MSQKLCMGKVGWMHRIHDYIQCMYTLLYIGWILRNMTNIQNYDPEYPDLEYNDG